MDDYLKATYKSNGKFTLLKMLVNGQMNPESSLVDFVQDGDLNKSLGHFCNEVLEEMFFRSLRCYLRFIGDITQHLVANHQKRSSKSNDSRNEIAHCEAHRAIQAKGQIL